MVTNFYNNKIYNKLSLLEKCANIHNYDETFKDYENMLKHKILEEKHKYKITYYEKEGFYKTYLPDDSRKEKRKPIKRTKLEDLEEAIISFYMELEEANNNSNMTLEDLFKKWVIWKRDETSVKPKTIQEYVSTWNKFIRDTNLPKMCVKDITPKIAIRFFRSTTKNKAYTYKQISNVRSILNGMMSYAIEEEIIVFNPIREVNLKVFDYKPIESQIKNVYSMEEVIKLLSHLKTIENEPYALAIQLFFYLFIRIGEFKSIKKEDINLEEGTIYLHTQALTERTLNDDLTFSPRKVTISNEMKGSTSNGYRYQYLTNEAIEIIKKALVLNPNGTYLFEPRGKLMTTDRFNDKLEKYCNECGVKYRSSHKIRFFNTSTSYLNGTDVNTLSKCLGHSQISTTLHYIRDVRQNDNTREAFANLGLSSQKAS